MNRWGEEGMETVKMYEDERQELTDDIWRRLSRIEAGQLDDNGRKQLRDEVWRQLSRLAKGSS
jgi:hypothetical protein